MSQVDNSNPNYITLDQNQIKIINYPDLSNYVPPPSYNSMPKYQNTQDELKQQRIQFLFDCYKNQAISFLIVLIIQILGLTKWFMSISTKFSKINLAGYYTSYSEYKKYYPNSQTYDEYENWRQSQWYEISEVRWTFYVIITLLILNTLAILFGRINRTIVKYQISLFFSQAVLIGLSLVGYAGKYKDNYWIHKDICYVTITTNSILLLNSIVILSLIKIDKLNYYNKFANNLIYMQIPFNFILVLIFKNFEAIILIFESIAIYGFYYFNQLNYSLLLNPEDLPVRKDITKLFQEITPINNESQGIEQKNPNLLTIPKKTLVIIGALGIQIILIIFLIITRNQISCVPLILLAGSIVGLIFETQVASRSLQFDDNFIAASIVYLDLLCPIQNFVRSIGVEI
ncbi:unnamed protein product [Paramecium pentaurelia]|uniref:Uncharacterized protein n=1 Tax=Paramecium pentaurelia TaxID=43138 RepID=A0A8S1XT47_9CILI|nr:unnamed protein product [Paramecium pentaurelia]